MRYRLLINTLLLGMLLCANTTYAKSRKISRGKGQPSFGVKVGGSLNRMTLKHSQLEKIYAWQQPVQSSGNILFITGGLTGEYPLSPQFAATAEISYERKGAYEPVLMLQLQHETISIPISVKYYPENMGEGISLQLGIQPSFIFSKKYYRLEGDPKEEKLKAEAITEEDLTESEITSSKAKPLDVALIAGVEYTFVTGLKIGTIISMGLRERRESKEAEDKNTVVSAGNQFYIGYNLAKLL